MEIIIRELEEGEEEQIIIKCHQLSVEQLQLINSFKAKAQTQTQGNFLIGYKGGEVQRVDSADVFYFESVDKKVFIYCEDNVLESRQKLYELEESLGTRDFLRISKSAIVNLNKIKRLSPALSGRLEVILENEERIMISRQYVGELKRSIGL